MTENTVIVTDVNSLPNGINSNTSSSHIVLEAEWVICVTEADTPQNFIDYYREDDDLNSDFLMAPVNEADYDSETQCMVDAKNANAPKSFYDHFVIKRKKKKKKVQDGGGDVGNNNNSSKSVVSIRSTVTAPSVPVRCSLVPRSYAADVLTVPRSSPFTDPRKGFRDASSRRLACGRMPPISFLMEQPDFIPKNELNNSSSPELSKS
jgi:hypothetical protein